jgi:hypothetical protein
VETRLPACGATAHPQEIIDCNLSGIRKVGEPFFQEVDLLQLPTIGQLQNSGGNEEIVWMLKNRTRGYLADFDSWGKQKFVWTVDIKRAWKTLMLPYVGCLERTNYPSSVSLPGPPNCVKISAFPAPPEDRKLKREACVPSQLVAGPVGRRYAGLYVIAEEVAHFPSLQAARTSSICLSERRAPLALMDCQAPSNAATKLRTASGANTPAST